MKRETSKLKIDKNLVNQRFLTSGVSASWETWPEGYRQVEARGNVVAGWLQLVTIERGRNSSRTTFYTFNRDQVLALRNLCNKILGQ